MVDLAPPYAPTADTDVAQSSRSWRAAIIDFCRRQPLGTVGLLLVLAMAVAGLSAEWTVAPFLIMLTAFVGQAILAEASLSYLGLGVQEPTAAWGLMLQGGAEEYASTAPWIAIFPGLAIALTVFGFSLFGDALRDALDPKLRDR